MADKNKTKPSFGRLGFSASALARERRPMVGAQKPPAMRVGLKLKQRNILSDIMVNVQATNKNQKGCFLWQIV
ncbi:MAG: hypothetical protein KH282_01135 [Clostridiales bacterium]|nr:hypothetical protein [Clostridiales bacterium]